MKNITTFSAVELHYLLKERKISCKEILDNCFQQIEKTDSKINAFISLDKENAYQKAVRIDKKFDAGEELPFLAGIPIAIKDNICIKGLKTTCASKILENFVSPYNATVINKLEKNHLIPIGKNNLDEFAMGSSTENSAFFTTKNPWDLTRIPGGSSGGSAASVATRQIPLALGSDTGGSIRQPASLCGIVGLKPTYGRVSRYGLVAFASSLDQIGPLTKTVEESAYLLNCISGHDPNDSTSAKKENPDFTKNLKKGIKGLKIGVPKELLGENIDKSILQRTYQALDLLKKEGASWELTSLPSIIQGISTYYILAPAEASANLARYDGVRYTFRAKEANNLRQMYSKTRGQGFGAEVKRRIILGTYALSAGYYDAYYLKALKARQLFKEDFKKSFEKYDVLITPSTPTTAFKIGEKIEDPLSMYLEDIATIPVNLAGLPAISIPNGFIEQLPIGLQIIGKAFDEETILKVGYLYQQITDFHMSAPTIGS